MYSGAGEVLLMLHRILASRGFISVISVVVLTALVTAAYVLIVHPAHKTLSYCALMPDSIGLYTGNHVTMLGMPVGTVTSIAPQGPHVRVDFTVDARYPVPADAAATTVSQTLVADRDLAVLGDRAGKGHWDAHTCITDTLTPKSMSQTFDALNKLADELDGGGNPSDQNQVGNGIAALNNSTTDLGPRINAIIHKLGVALASPDAAIGHIGAIVDALTSLAASTAGGWNDIKSMLTRFAPVLNQIDNQLVAPVIEILSSLFQFLPIFNEITTLYGSLIRRGLDATVPAVRFLAAHVGTLQDIITMIPPITTAFSKSIDPVSHEVSLIYASPKIALPVQQSKSLCDAINAITPGRCTDAAGTSVSVPLVPLVLGMAGAR
ncbi:MlaD family protein [Nocardia sp. CA2R105]|uniref:MlaD family protein n=1 Tax=Nocardia coffeae TaxID=2873381 RepID=UPI001CA77979|nr:MlaD family protein [Nocardia coffeae]MBY8863420.1 MlaD family protein [Nocardia coffeae]